MARTASLYVCIAVRKGGAIGSKSHPAPVLILIQTSRKIKVNRLQSARGVIV